MPEYPIDFEDRKRAILMERARTQRAARIKKFKEEAPELLLKFGLTPLLFAIAGGLTGSMCAAMCALFWELTWWNVSAAATLLAMEIAGALGAGILFVHGVHREYASLPKKSVSTRTASEGKVLRMQKRQN